MIRIESINIVVPYETPDSYVLYVVIALLLVDSNRHFEDLLLPR